MLKRLLLGLVVANGLLLAWGAGVLPGLPPPGEGEREPDRLQRQLRPDAVRVLATGAAAAGGVSPGPAAVADAAGATSQAACLETRALPATEAARTRALIASLGLPTAQVRETALPGVAVWTLYMGPYAGDEQLRQKQEQLRRIRLEANVLRQGPEPGLALTLGRYDDRAQAEAALAQYAQRGLRTARVLALEAPQADWQWRIEGVDGATRSRLTALSEAGWQPCVTAGR